MSVPHIDEVPNRLSQAAPWWIALGVTGVALTLNTGAGPLLTSVALIGIGSDADLLRRLREAVTADGEAPRSASPAIVAGFVRRFHAAMYLFLIAFAWASMLHLAGKCPDPAAARWWLAADLAACSLIGLGYSRLARLRA